MLLQPHSNACKLRRMQALGASHHTSTHFPKGRAIEMEKQEKGKGGKEYKVKTVYILLVRALHSIHYS